MNGLLIFWYASWSLFVREDCLSLNHIWLVILFSIVSTSDVHMWWSQAFGVGIKLSPLSKSCSQVSGAFDSPIINEFSIPPPRLSIFVILILRLLPSSQIVFFGTFCLGFCLILFLRIRDCSLRFSLLFVSAFSVFFFLRLWANSSVSNMILHFTFITY